MSKLFALLLIIQIGLECFGQTEADISATLQKIYTLGEVKVSSFDDDTYSTQNMRSSFNSFYDDYTLGGNLEFASGWNAENNLRASFHAKNDNHSEYDEGEPVRHFADNTFSLGIENVYKPGLTTGYCFKNICGFIF
jgi:hypothetical protein